MATDAGLTAEHPVKAKPRRRWFQFSLRTLLVLVLAFGCGFGWLAYQIKRARQQRKAVVEIVQRGAGVGFRGVSGRMVALLGRLLGDGLLLEEYLVVDVDAVFFSDETVANTDLDQLRRLTNLEKLSLTGTQVTDAGLVHLRGLTKLTTLEVDNTKTTDAGLVHLHGLTNLMSLSLRGSQVTDAGVNELRKALPKVTIYR